MAKSLIGMMIEARGVCGDLDDEAMVPIWFERGGHAGALAHFAGSSVCQAKSVPGGSPTFGSGAGPGSEVVGLTMRYAAKKLVYANTYCETCFAGAGLRELKVWAETDAAPEALAVFLVRYEFLALWQRCEHVRSGLANGRAFGTREAPVVMHKVAKMRTRILAMSTDELLVHKAAIELFEAAAGKLEALVEPGDGEWALGKLRVRLVGGRGKWVVLDETPTILAIEGGANWRIRKSFLGPELMAALRVSDPSNDSLVVYGPRYAIDYLQRAYGDSYPYVMATTEEDAAVAKLAGGLWGTTAGIPDLFCALEAARSLMAGG